MGPAASLARHPRLNVPLVCAIGCTEPWNAAGLGLDVRALADCGVRVVSVVAGVTAQDRLGLHAGSAIAPELIAAQFDALANAPIAAYRVGALLDAASVHAVAAQLGRRSVPIVYDPVLGPSGGGSFAGAGTQAAIRAELLALATIVTPNLREAAALCEWPPLLDLADMERAGRALVAAGATSALVKGGHLAGEASDVFVDAAGARVYASPRIPGELRGTGCLLACALAAALARGAPLPRAVETAREFVRERFAVSFESDGARTAY